MNLGLINWFLSLSRIVKRLIMLSVDVLLIIAILIVLPLIILYNLKLKQLPLKKGKDNVVRLSDVANIEFGPVSEKALFRAQRKDALNLKMVGIGIYARSGASTVELSKEIKKRVEEVKQTLPEG